MLMDKLSKLISPLGTQDNPAMSCQDIYKCNGDNFKPGRVVASQVGLQLAREGCSQPGRVVASQVRLYLCIELLLSFLPLFPFHHQGSTGSIPMRVLPRMLSECPAKAPRLASHLPIKTARQPVPLQRNLKCASNSTQLVYKCCAQSVEAV